MDTQASSDPVMKQLLAQLETARRKLVETGTRNRLIHVNRKSTQSNVINIVNERSDDVFRILKTDGKKMKFRATGTDRKPDESNATGEDTGQLVLLEQISEFDDAPDDPRRMRDSSVGRACDEYRPRARLRTNWPGTAKRDRRVCKTLCLRLVLDRIRMRITRFSKASKWPIECRGFASSLGISNSPPYPQLFPRFAIQRNPCA